MNCCGRKDKSRNWLGHGAQTKAEPSVNDVIIDGPTLITFKSDGTSQYVHVPVLNAKKINFFNASGTTKVATVYVP